MRYRTAAVGLVPLPFVSHCILGVPFFHNLHFLRRPLPPATATRTTSPLVTAVPVSGSRNRGLHGKGDGNLGDHTRPTGLLDPPRRLRRPHLPHRAGHGCPLRPHRFADGPRPRQRLRHPHQRPFRVAAPRPHPAQQATAFTPSISRAPTAPSSTTCPPPSVNSRTATTSASATAFIASSPAATSKPNTTKKSTASPSSTGSPTSTTNAISWSSSTASCRTRPATAGRWC